MYKVMAWRNEQVDNILDSDNNEVSKTLNAKLINENIFRLSRSRGIGKYIRWNSPS